MAARPPRRFKIYLLIPDHPGLLHIDPQFLRRFQYQSRRGLPTITSFIGPVRAIVDTVNCTAESCKLVTEFLMYLRHFMMSGEPSPNDRLIRYDDDSESPFLNLSKGSLDTWKNLKLFRSLNVVLSFPSEDAIPVEENRPKQGQPAAPQKT